MSWQDVFGVTDRMIRTGFFQPSAGPVRAFTPFKYDESNRLRSSQTVTWSNLARGRLPAASQPTQARPSAPLERVNIQTPYSSTRPGSQFGPPRVEPTSSQGDLPGSVLGAIGGVAQNLNLANAIPWFMERVNVLSGELADSDVPVANVIGRGIEVPTGAFLDGVEAASNVIAPILDAFPNYVRDEQLKDRAKVYAAIVRGESPDLGLGGVGNPLSTANELFMAPLTIAGRGLQEHFGGTPLADVGGHLAGGGPMAALVGRGVTAQGSEADMWRRIMLNAVDPQQRLRAEQQLAILRDTIDLPESVKYAIEQGGKFESDDDFRALIAAAPEGKSWSYDPGAKGFVSNLANPLVFYLAEANAGLRLGQGIGALGTQAGGTVGSAIRLGGQALTVGANLQKWSVAAGVGLTGITTAMDAVARYQGAEEAIAFFDRVNRPTDFSESFNVQLATGFMVNPVAAAGSLKRGVLTLKHGVDVPVSKVLGNKLSTYYTNESQMLGMIQRMYRLKSADEAGDLLDRFYDTRAEGYDEVLNAALDVVMSRLPSAEKAIVNASHADPIERTTFALQRFGRQAVDLIQKEPEVVAARFNQYAWEYHQYPQAFNAEVAALNARDIRTGRAMTYDLRAQTNTVLGYREYLPPQGVSLARQWIDDVADPEGTIAVQGVDGVQDLIRKFPALRKHWQGIVTTEARVPRAAVETMIGRAEAEWALKTQQNPIRVKTGADPVLRPDSPTPTRDLSEALGAGEDTVKAIESGATDGDGLALIRRFLEQKLGMQAERVAAMPPDEAVLQAQKYVEDTTRPWREAGSAVVNAERGIADVRAELVRLRAMPKGTSSTLHDRIVRLEAELTALTTLVRASSDPLVPFAESLSTAQLSGRGPIAARIRKMNADSMTPRDRQVVTRYLEDVMLDTRHTRAGLVEHAVPAAKTTPIPDAPAGLPQAEFVKFVKQQKAARDARVSEIIESGESAEFPLRDGAKAIVSKDARTGGWRKTHIDAEGTPTGHIGYNTYREALEDVGSALYGPVKVMGKGPTNRELLQRVMDYLDSTPTGQARDLHLSELAARRVNATVRLRQIEAIDAQGAQMAGDGNLPWQMFSKVEGNWQWSGGLPPVSRSMRARLAEGLKAAGQRGNAHEAQIMGDAEAWRLIRDTPEVMEQLTPAQRRAANRTLSSGKHHFDYDEHAEAWIRQTGETSEDWFEQMVRLLDEREALLEGATEYNLRRTAAIKMPQPYVLAAERQADEALTGPVYDPEWETVTHPQNVAALATALDSPETFPAAREIVAGDEILSYELRKLGEKMGLADNEIDDVLLGDPDYAAAIRNALIPADFVPPTPGVVDVIGKLDEAIVSGNVGALEQLADEAVAAADTPNPPKKVRKSVAQDAAAQAPQRRLSIQFRRKLSAAGVDFSQAPDAGILDAPGNALGVKVLSVLNHGIAGTKPATLKGVIALLRVIEDGDATRMGIGPGLQAQAQRVARELLDRAAIRSTRSAENAGLFEKGFFPEDEAALAAQLEDMLIVGNEADPLGTLQYGLKKPPKDAVVLEWSRVPGLAEELLGERFLPFEERVPTALTRQAYNFVFGPRGNAAIAAEARQRFVDRAAAHGVDAQEAAAIYTAWHDLSRSSRDPVLKIGQFGRRTYLPGDNPLYATVANIPTRLLDEVAQKVIDERWASGQLAGDGAYYGHARTVDYGSMFRESTSFIRRNLKDKAPLGDALASAYGLAAHNKAVTTLYYWFRFALDIRFHAMNYLEAPILHMGRAGLRKGEIDDGLFGMTEQYLRRLDEDPGVNNTGYAMGRDRMAYAYKTFLKEQPDALRAELKGLQTENPKLMQRVIEGIAKSDPQIQDMIREFGDTPQGYLRALDDWHGKLLANMDEAGDAAVIDDALALELKDSPELAEVLDRIGQVNRDLWTDVRATFYGNPNRSRAERFLNSYLLFWPLSYQVKSTKWFLKVLFDRVGGMPTNAAGAVMVDRIAEQHNRMIATDPEYRDWFERHDTLVFAAQMFFPVSFEGTGVSLNPALRSMFFERNKAVWEIGPVYTFNQVLRPSLEEAYVDLYPTLKDAPGFDGLYRALTGRQAPKMTGSKR
jgi:hypothetical protein